ncbi:hypothetical protein, partial [Bradyrhizobium sp. LMTR 3]|uniref:hypothetical protein n=1 Tax=Bradyrhizobium sp. LMTR 3 TaxID=189873 RepID=UPI001AECEBFC
RRCQPCATPSSNSSLDYRRSDARIAENGFATSGGVSKSAKVVLAAVANFHFFPKSFYLPTNRERHELAHLHNCWGARREMGSTCSHGRSSQTAEVLA